LWRATDARLIEVEAHSDDGNDGQGSHAAIVPSLGELRGEALGRSCPGLALAETGSGLPPLGPKHLSGGGGALQHAVSQRKT